MNALTLGLMGGLLFGQAGGVDVVSAMLRNEVFVAFGFLTLVIVVPVLAYFWHVTRVKELEASLKHEMLQRGFSVDDIVRIIGSGPKMDWRCKSRQHAANAATTSPQSVLRRVFG